jgi:excisionase family DNA binding protein
MNPTTLPLPNPQDWCDIPQACELLGRSRATVYDMRDRGVLHVHKIGSASLLWRAEVLEVATALRRLEVGAAGPRSTVRA